MEVTITKVARCMSEWERAVGRPRRHEPPFGGEARPGAAAGCDPRLDRATELQKVYLRAMAELGPEAQKASDVAEAMGRQSTQVAPTRAELINMGLLYTPEHGYAAFTVPHFDQFMLRVMPTLVVAEIRKRKRRSTDTS